MPSCRPSPLPQAWWAALWRPWPRPVADPAAPLSPAQRLDAERQAARDAERQLGALAGWALRFSPRVSRQADAILLESRASQRLFGGPQALQAQVEEGARTLGAVAVGWAATGLGALALARAGGGVAQTLPAALDPLPLEVLDAAAGVADTLRLLGCSCLGELRGLPREGLARRFGAGLLEALDRAYGEAPDPQDWIRPPELFEARRELSARVHEAPALAAGAQPLLEGLATWLAARQAGAQALALLWEYDSMRARSVEPEGQLLLRTARPTRQVAHLARLLAEHLARVRLPAAVAALRLRLLDWQPLAPVSGALLPDTRQQAQALDEVLEQVAARLGPERVARPQPVEDHRPECMQVWQPWGTPAARARVRPPPGPQPAFLLPEPQRLAVRAHRPLHQGQALLLMLGPHRLEAGWWHRSPPGAAPAVGGVARDYWVAWSEAGALLWVFRTRLADEPEPAWFLHGLFA